MTEGINRWDVYYSGIDGRMELVKSFTDELALKAFLADAWVFDPIVWSRYEVRPVFPARIPVPAR